MEDQKVHDSLNLTEILLNEDKDLIERDSECLKSLEPKNQILSLVCETTPVENRVERLHSDSTSARKFNFTINRKAHTESNKCKERDYASSDKKELVRNLKARTIKKPYDRTHNTTKAFSHTNNEINYFSCGENKSELVPRHHLSGLVSCSVKIPKLSKEVIRWYTKEMKRYDVKHVSKLIKPENLSGNKEETRLFNRDSAFVEKNVIVPLQLVKSEDEVEAKPEEEDSVISFKDGNMLRPAIDFESFNDHFTSSTSENGSSPKTTQRESNRKTPQRESNRKTPQRTSPYNSPQRTSSQDTPLKGSSTNIFRKLSLKNDIRNSEKPNYEQYLPDAGVSHISIAAENDNGPRLCFSGCSVGYENLTPSTSQKGSSLNTSQNGSSLNTSQKGLSLNTSQKGSSVNTSKEGSSLTTFISSRISSRHTSARRSSPNKFKEISFNNGIPNGENQNYEQYRSGAAQDDNGHRSCSLGCSSGDNIESPLQIRGRSPDDTNDRSPGKTYHNESSSNETTDNRSSQMNYNDRVTNENNIKSLIRNNERRSLETNSTSSSKNDNSTLLRIDDKHMLRNDDRSPIRNRSRSPLRKDGRSPVSSNDSCQSKCNATDENGKTASSLIKVNDRCSSGKAEDSAPGRNFKSPFIINTVFRGKTRVRSPLPSRESTTSNKMVVVSEESLLQMNRNIEILEANQRYMMSLLDILVREKTVNSSGTNTVEDPDNIHLPVTSNQMLEQLEQQLEDEKNVKHLFCELSKIGGNHAADAVRRIFRSTFSDEIASLYSWKGLKGKKTFCDLRIAKIIIDTVTAIQSFQTTIAEVEKHIKLWLRHASDRIKSKRNIEKGKLNN